MSRDQGAARCRCHLCPRGDAVSSFPLLYSTVLHNVSIDVKEVFSLPGHKRRQHWAPSIYPAAISL